MKNKLLPFVGFIFILVFLLLFWQQNHRAGQPASMALTSQEEKTVDSILKDRKNYCFGSFRITLPGDMTLDKGIKPFIRIDDVSLVSQSMYYPSFEQLIRLREAELKVTKPIDPADGHYLKSSYPLENGVIFERMESIGVPDSERVLEAHFYKDGVAFTLESTARDETTKRYEIEIKQHPELAGNNVPQKINELRHLIENISARKDDEFFSSPGLCIPDAFIDTSGLTNFHQDVVITLKSKKYPQLSIVLETRNYNPDSESLLAYREYAEPGLHKNGGYVIRKGDKHIDRFFSQEWLVKDLRNVKKEYFDFYLLINGQQASQQKPMLLLNLVWEQNMNNEKLTDAQIMAVWDEIIETIQRH